MLVEQKGASRQAPLGRGQDKLGCGKASASHPDGAGCETLELSPDRRLGRLGAKRKRSQEIPNISKPGFTRVDIDQSRESGFAKELLAMPAQPIQPRWLVDGRDLFWWGIRTPSATERMRRVLLTT